jgi:hypothetical protein
VTVRLATIQATKCGYDSGDNVWKAMINIGVLQGVQLKSGPLTKP